MTDAPPPAERAGLASRDVAAEVVFRVCEEGAYVQHALSNALERSDLDARDRGFATELVYGTLTWLRPIDLALERVLTHGIERTDTTLVALLRVATYQLGWRADTVPAFAVVHETVELVRRLRGRRKGGFVNAVLRSMLRDIEHVFQPPKKLDAVGLLGHTSSLPPWMAEQLVARLGLEEAAEAMTAWNAPTPVVVRWRGDSAPEGEDAERLTAHALVPGAYVVDGPVHTLPALEGGRAVVQDAGAQLAAAAFPDELAGRVWDVCAGVGGKTRHLADRFGADRVVASDNLSPKLGRLRADVPGVETHVWDAGEGAPPPTVERVGAVLIDAPCSGLGSIGRHPDTRWNRGPEIVDELAALQRRILDHIAPLVPPGGWLVYMVCTWTPAEGVEQVRAFVERHPEFRVVPPEGAPWGDLVDGDGCVSVWPHRHRTDGFYLARLRRQPG